MKVQSQGQEDPLEEGMQPTSVLMHGESHAQRSLWATVHSVAKSWTRLSNLAHMHTNMNPDDHNFELLKAS